LLNAGPTALRAEDRADRMVVRLVIFLGFYAAPRNVATDVRAPGALGCTTWPIGTNAELVMVRALLLTEPLECVVW
jgi:hypothetical protein